MKSVISIKILFVLLFVISCISTKEINKKSELKYSRGKGDLIVLANDSSIYKLEDFKLSDTLISGLGTVEKNGEEKKFSGSIEIQNISYIQLRYFNLVNTLFAATASAVVGGLALSYLNNNDNISVNEWIRTYYPGGGGGGWGGGGFGSCPLVFVLDNNEFVLKSETFGGAIFKLAERVCYDNLGNIPTPGNRITLKLANYLTETDYMNELKLFSVKVPNDVITVIPAVNGKFHTIREKVAPESCIDFSGVDVKSKIIECDSIIWSSELENKDLTKKENMRDGLILEFEKHKVGKRCKLVVTGKNTALGNFAINQILQLNGENLLQWYQKIESNRNEGMKVLEWMLREGMLHISIWDGNRWKECSAILDPGPILYRENIAELELPAISGENLKIKLECALDLWMIDQVYLDYTDDYEIVANEIPIERAIDNYSGKDISSLIRKDDEKYYTAFPGQYAIIEFDIPNSNPLENHTYILKTKGYYHPWTAPDGEYNPALWENILKEPSLAGTLYMEKWKQFRANQ